MFIGRYALEKSYIAGIDDLNDKEYEEIAPRILETDPGDIDAAVESIVAHTEIDASLYFFQIARSDDSVFFTSSNLAGHHLPVEVHGKRVATVGDDELGLLRSAEYKVNGYDLHIASSLQGWETLNARLLQVLGVILSAVLVASLVVGYFLSRVALNPLANIERTANRIGVGNLSERIEIPNTKDELARLCLFLNELFDRLESAVLQAQKFASDASHELKTPLSLVRLRTESLLKAEDAVSEERREELEEQLKDIERLGLVIDDLLLLSKSEAGVLKLDLQERGTLGFLEDFAEDASALCEDRGVRFRLEEKARGVACYDDTWLRHTLFNLLSNALKFSSVGAEVYLESKIEEGRWVLLFQDEGPGVEAVKLTRIFERFYSDTTGLEESGSGLGLALCKSIVLQHRGTIAAKNREDGSGLLIEIRLPLSFDG